VYIDDAQRRAPPEFVPGSVPLVGIEGHEVQRLQKGRYTFQLHIMGLPGYRPDDEQRELSRLDAPLTADVNRPADLVTAPAAPR